VTTARDTFIIITFLYKAEQRAALTFIASLSQQKKYAFSDTVRISVISRYPLPFIKASAELTVLENEDTNHPR
jgi:hypothetical protein